MIMLPAAVTGAQPTGAPETIRAVTPTCLAGPSAHATSQALGAHLVRLPLKTDAVEAVVDRVPVLYLCSRNGAQINVLADTRSGVVELIGWTGEQLDAIRGDHFGGLGITTAKAPAAGTTVQLTSSVDGNLDNTFLATRATAGGDREVSRLVALADTLDDNGSSGDADVDRLAKLGDSLSDG